MKDPFLTVLEWLSVSGLMQLNPSQE